MTPPGTPSGELAVWFALVSTVVLILLHLAAPRVRRLPLVPERVTGSFAGGIAVAYVFLHLMPELAQGHTRVRAVLGDESTPAPLVELGIFLVALGGFLAFYLLEHAAAAASGDRRGRASGGGALFAVHLGAYALYNGVITYTMPLTYRTGIGFAVLFTFAMGLHFVLSDRGLHEHYGDWFDRRSPRILLAAALLAGWVLAAVMAPTNVLVVSLLTALLSGSVLLNVFKEELPAARRSSIGWFTAGLAAYAVLLALVTALGEESDHADSAGSAVRESERPRT